MNGKEVALGSDQVKGHFPGIEVDTFLDFLIGQK
jgi:hypothetical protein